MKTDAGPGPGPRVLLNCNSAKQADWVNSQSNRIPLQLVDKYIQPIVLAAVFQWLIPTQYSSL